MPGSLDSKIAIVTGGNSGIGRAIVARFLHEGASVVFTGRDQATIDDTITSLAEFGDRVIGLRSDVSDLSSHADVVAKTATAFGGLDVFVANAGVASVTPFMDADEAHYDQIMGINLKGLFFGAQAAARAMNERGGGSIVFTGSVASVKGIPGYAVYSATKGGVRSLTRVLAAELADLNIRVNVLSPGVTDTPILSRQGVDASAIEANFIQQIPQKRMAKADEMANATLFLASDASSYVTGADLHVDGGIAQV